MSIMPLQPHRMQREPTTETPSPGLHPRPTTGQTPEEIVLEPSTFPELGRPPSIKAIDMAGLPPLDHRGPRHTVLQGSRPKTKSSPPQGFSNPAYDSHPDTHFSVIPARPPLRPTPSFSTDIPFSYYSSASLDLEHKSMAVAAEEEASTLRYSGLSGLRLYACLITLLILNFFCGVDTSALALFLPTLATTFVNSSNHVFWIVNSYLLSAALFTPLAMRISSAVGVKIVILTGLTIWTAGSLGCALSGSFTALIVLRCVSGAGAGIVGVSLLPTLQQVRSDRTTAMDQRILSLSFWLGLALGPVIGLAFAEAGHWRYLFFVNLPVGIIATLTMLLFLRIPGPVGWRQALRDIDYLHWILVPAAVVPLVWSLSAAGTTYSWISWHTLLPLFASCVCFISWCICGSISVNPILPVSLLRTPAALATAFGTVAHGMIVISIVYFVPLLASTLGVGGIAQFASLLQWTLSLAAASLVGWNIESRAGHCVSIAGWPLLSASIGLMLLLDSSNFHITSIPLGIIAGLILGILASHLSTSFQSAASTDDETIYAAPMLSFLTSLGYALGVAVSSCVLLNRLNDQSSSTLNIFTTINDFYPEAILLHDITTSLHTLWLTLCILSGIAAAITVICALIRRPSKPEFTIQYLESWPQA